ncbi:MAG: methylated-DNA--[protein]-cysteine S-methyltransferase [Chloroflexi bacterium]|nr:methylated-DNA--[protein]-cysteine S-methyltransferase [Chloroflexota bacterium]
MSVVIFNKLGYKGKNDFSYGKITNTLIGNVWIAVTKTGLVAIDFDMEEHEFINQTEELTGGHAIPPNEHVENAATQLRMYLEGKTTEILFPVDLSNVSRFQRAVLETVAKVERGQVVTYGDIARMIGKPGASQAVGQALRRNPTPISVPCHRVLSADGTLGGYGGRMGSERKIELLKLEGVILT